MMNLGRGLFQCLALFFQLLGVSSKWWRDTEWQNVMVSETCLGFGCVRSWPWAVSCLFGPKAPPCRWGNWIPDGLCERAVLAFWKPEALGLWNHGTSQVTHWVADKVWGLSVLTYPFLSNTQGYGVCFLQRRKRGEVVTLQWLPFFQI